MTQVEDLSGDGMLSLRHVSREAKGPSAITMVFHEDIPREIFIERHCLHKRDTEWKFGTLTSAHKAKAEGGKTQAHRSSSGIHSVRFSQRIFHLSHQFQINLLHQESIVGGSTICCTGHQGNSCCYRHCCYCCCY